MQKPNLIIIADPNGSGKTTVTEQGLGHQWFDGCQYINPDIIAEKEFLGWNDYESILKAAKKATQIRYDLIKRKENLAFETVFSSSEKIDFIKKDKQQGYFIRLFFICTESPIINAARITRRVLEGGHEVPITKIVSRYQKSILNALQANNLVDRLYLYDNSVDAQEPQLIVRFSEGKLIKLYDDLMFPAWAKGFLEDKK